MPRLNRFQKSDLRWALELVERAGVVFSVKQIVKSETEGAMFPEIPVWIGKSITEVIQLIEEAE